MRASAPLRAQAQGQTQQGRLLKTDPPARKIFNCIVDDTAFLAGVKKSTRDGIRKWINNGAMRLFVPLYTLEHVDRIKRAGGKPAIDAQEALQWLDDVTSISEVEAAGLVQLQGGEEVYRTWEEVEAFLLPETLLSMTESADEADDLADELNNSLGSLGSAADKASESSNEANSKTSESPRSAYSATSPGLLNATPYKAETAVNKNGKARSRNNSRTKPEQKNKSVVPVPLQPFFNHIIWRIHHEQNPDITPESFILLTNDPRKQAIAQRFSVRAKRLEQMRDIIGREERDFRNRQAWIKKEEQDAGAPAVEEQKSEDEDEVVFKRTPAPKPKAGQQQVFDPNDFGRSQQVPTPRGGGRGGRAGHRGGRGNFTPTPAPRTPPVAPKNAEPSGPIDPDSYARPAPVARSLRGGRRKLWEPA